MERCDSCRDYWEKCDAFERQLRRSLAKHWVDNRTDLAWKEIAAQVVRSRKARIQQQKKLWQGVSTFLVVIFIAGLLVTQQIAARRQAQVPTTVNTAPSPTMTPTPVVTPFQGVIAYDAPRNGAQKAAQKASSTDEKDIYLLVAGPHGVDQTDLTDHPSRNTDPAWSPDGQWIAFISDRDTAQQGGNNRANEIYLMSIAGTRLTRLTDTHEIQWHGPLSWSMDKQWIAATGTRRSGNAVTSGLYLIDVSGQQPPRLLSDGGGYPKFSPAQPWLAFLAPGDAGLELYVYDYKTGTEFSVTGTGSWPVVSQLDGALYIGDNTDPAVAFDWEDDGSTLSYVTRRLRRTLTGYVPTMEVRQANDLPLDFFNVSYILSRRSNPLSLHLTSLASFTSPIYFVTWSAFGDLLYAPGGNPDAHSSSCQQTISVWQDARSDAPNLKLPGLCLLGAIRSTNWVLDHKPGDRGDWLVLPAFRNDNPTPGIYALHIPQLDENPRTAEVMRLANFPAGAGPLQVRPEVK